MPCLKFTSFIHSNYRLFFIKVNSNIPYFQHDQDFPNIESTNVAKGYKYLHELPEGERFFIRKFADNEELTAKQLRAEEYQLTSRLYSTPLNVEWHYHVRDFYALCGGWKLVRYLVPYKNHLKRSIIIQNISV